jgi:enamine deaminase RidA (YjgF/YER057c/UK114 family)
MTKLRLAWIAVAVAFMPFCREALADDPRLIRIGPDPQTGSSAAVSVADVPLVHTTQLVPFDSERGVVAVGDAAAQCEFVLDWLSRLLDNLRSGMDRIVRLNVYAANQDAADAARNVLAKRFAGDAKPAVTFVVGKRAASKVLVSLDAIAATELDPKTNVWGPAPIGSAPALQFSSAMPTGTRIYIAGQAEPGSSLAEATAKTLAGLDKTLAWLGRAKKDVAHIKSFLTPMDKVEDVRTELRKFFGESSVPPVSFVEWHSTLPIEIEMVVWGGQHQSGEPVEFLTPPWMKDSPVFCRVTRINQTRSIYTSGFVAAKADSAADEVHDVFVSLKKVLDASGSDFRHLAKATYYVSTDAASQKLNELRPQYYDPKRPPSASKAVVPGVGTQGRGLTLDMIAVPAISADKPEYGPEEFGHGLTPEQVDAGWISLFDGQTTFGWTDAKVQNGEIEGGRTTTEFGAGELSGEVTRAGMLGVGGTAERVDVGQFLIELPAGRSPIQLGPDLRIRRLALRPTGLKPLLNGRDLAGWQRVLHPRIAAEKQPEWKVIDGTVQVVGGPGCLEYTERPFDNLVLQLQVRTRLRHANGGVFFRAIPGDFLNGYEAQVYNKAEDGDPSRPSVWSTGSIDDRQLARRLPSRDREFFSYTIIAQGPHIATWVNGMQLVDWTDDRPEHDNPRSGRRTKPGAIQLQAHDPGSDLEFRAIFAGELK